MDKKNLVMVVEGKGETLTQAVKAAKEDLEVQRIDFKEAAESLKGVSPHLVIFSLDHQRKKVEEILKHFSFKLPKTHWIISAEETVSPEDLIHFIRLGVTDFIKQPLDQHELEDLLQRIDALDSKRSSEGEAEIHQVISFFSSKGGVGVSLAAVNFAVGIAKKKLGRVLIADFVLQHGNIAEFVDLVPQYTLLDVVENLERLDAKLLGNSIQKHRSGAFVLPCPRQPEESEVFSSKAVADMLKVLKSSFNYTVVDAGHELNAAAVSCLDLSDTIFLMTTPDLPSLCNTKASLETFKKLGYSQDKVKVLLNRWHMKGEIETPLIEKNMAHPVYQKLVEDQQLVLSSLNQGIPIVELSKNAELAKCFDELVERVARPLERVA